MGAQSSLSGATYGVESGPGEVIDLEIVPSRCSDIVLLGRNRRIPLAFAPCYSDKLVLFRMMECDGVATMGNQAKAP